MTSYPHRLGRVVVASLACILAAQCSDEDEQAAALKGSPEKEAATPGSSRSARSRDLASRASSIRQAALDLESRIGNLRKEISESENPAAVFREISQIIRGIKDPIGKRTIENLVIQALAPGNDPVDEFQWLKNHERDLLAYFKDGSGATSLNLYEKVCTTAGMNLQASRKSKEFLALVQGLPEEEVAKGVSLPVLSAWLAYGNEFDKLQTIDSPELKSSILGGSILVLEKLRSPKTPDEVTEMIETYLSPQYESFKDPGNETIDRFVSKAWYEACDEDIGGLLGTLRNPDSANRFLAALAYRSGEAQDGKLDSYLDQIGDENLRNETIRKIDAARTAETGGE